jgi:hypothetical protein
VLLPKVPIGRAGDGCQLGPMEIETRSLNSNTRVRGRRVAGGAVRGAAGAGPGHDEPAGPERAARGEPDGGGAAAGRLRRAVRLRLETATRDVVRTISMRATETGAGLRLETGG